jgi:adenylate cyclase
VFTTGVTIDIPDAQVDSRFNPEFDEETGFVTRSVLCVPVINKRGEVIGASQALSRTTGPFTYEDESRLKAFTAEISSVLESAQMFDATENMNEGKQGSVEIVSDGVITFDNQGNVMTCNTSGLKIMCATLEDILHRPAHEVFAGPNA